MRTAITKFILGSYTGAAIEDLQGVSRGMYGVGRPIYGIGLLLSSKSFVKNLWRCFAIEFFGSLVFDHDKKYWDYSNEVLNLDGRVCLKNTLAFAGIMTISAHLDFGFLLIILMALEVIRWS